MPGGICGKSYSDCSDLAAIHKRSYDITSLEYLFKKIKLRNNLAYLKEFCIHNILLH